MGLAGFNRTRARLAEEHKKRVEAQKVIKPSKVKPKESKPLPEVTEENKEEIKVAEPKPKRKRSKSKKKKVKNA
jgi:hypothetical protein